MTFKILLALCFFIFLPTTSMHASNNPTDNNKKPSFSVKIIQSELQQNSSLLYYNFNGKPNETYTLDFQLKNLENKKTNVIVYFKNSLTSSSGDIVYTTDEKTEYSFSNNNAYLFSKYIEGPELVELEPNEVKNVSYTVTIPEHLTKGELLGAFGFIDEVEANIKPNESKAKGTTLIGRMKYVIATFIQLPEKSPGNIIINDAKLNIDSVHPKIELSLENSSTTLLKDLSISYKVYENKKPGTVLFERKKQIGRFTPATNTLYSIDFETEILETSEYSIEVEISGDSLENSVFKKIGFSITKEEEVVFSEKTIQKPVFATGKPTTFLDYIWYALIGFSLFVLGLVTPYFIRRKSIKNKNKKL